MLSAKREDRLFFSVCDELSDRVQDHCRKNAQEESDDIHPQVIDIALTDLEYVLTAFDDGRKDYGNQAQDPLILMVSPPKLKVESERREDQKISEELDEDTVRETA